MTQRYIVIMLMFIIGLGADLLFTRIARRREIASNMVRAALFFFCVNYFLMSIVKAFLGEPENTLIESLWDMDYRTCIHYGVPLCIIEIILPFVIVIILKENAQKFIDLFVADIISGGVFIFIACGGISSNFAFCILFIACAVLAFVMAFSHKKELLFFSKKEYIKGVKDILPSIVMAAVMIVLYFPCELFLGNIEEFPCSFWELFGMLLVGTLVSITVVLMTCLFLLPKELSRFYSILLFGVMIMGYLQSMFLNGKLDMLDGGMQVWGIPKQVINSLIWIFVIGSIIFIGFRKKSAERIYKTVCIYICLIQVVSLGYMIFTTNTAKENQDSELTTFGSLELSGKNNVVVFVLDRFESEILENIMETDNAFLDALSDFTFYDNTTSQFSTTRASVPHLLTGVAWNGGLWDEYAEYAYSQSTALSTMAQNGYQLGVYTAIRYYTPRLYNLTINYRENVEKHCTFVDTISTMYKTSMYKIMPFALKSIYSYYSTDINSIAQSEEIWDIENDLPFYNSLIQEGLTINGDYDKVFRFYHMIGAHAPYCLSEDMEYDKTGRQVSEWQQSRASLKIVYEYLQQMKELGIYDDATIIITADHGQRIERASLVDGKPAITSRPILLVKEAGVSQEAMVVNDTPVSQENIIPTLLKAMGIDWHEYGRTLEEVPADEKSERTYVDFDLIEQYIMEYAINGDARELGNWSLKKEKAY